MLRWMNGVIKMNKKRNEIIRGTAKKVQESRLKWYGHVLRREEGYVIDVPGEKNERKTEAEVIG